MDVDSDNESIEGMELSAADAETDALADSFRDPKMARVLTCIPQALPFERRVKLFHSLLQTDKLKTQDEAAEYRRAMVAMMRREEEELNFDGIREKVKIRRKYLYNDSMEQLNALGPKLKRKVQVSFINQHGAQEAGIDGGGVFKEFLDDLIKDGFTANSEDESHHVGAPRLFSVTPLQTLAVNSDMTQDPSMLEHYEFLGRVLGKALYESILVEPQFCLPFLNQLLGKPNSLEDLKNFDAEYYTNLTKLRFLSQDEIDSLGLTFDLTIGDSQGSARPRTVELIRGGQNKPVTKQNVIQYIHLVAHQRLNVQGALETRAFLRGFRDLIPASWVRLFSANELQKLIGGDDSVRGIDVASLKRSMQYAAGYHASQPLIQAFWEILDDFTPDQQRKFLKFMTSCSRQPLLGFASLEPAPCIQQIRLPETESTKNSRLPTSSTCMNLLKLPNYPDKELMRSKLIAAIEAGAGFELT
jgi:ubiquitin-protein ligase E3 C